MVTKPHAERTTESADRTRSALIDAAVRALAEVGFAKASAREIAGRAGVNQALVFYHFGTVADLLLAALDQVSSARLQAYTELIDGAASLTALVDSAEAIFVADLDAGYVAVLVEMVNGARPDPDLSEQVAARLQPWLSVATSAIERVQRLLPLPAPIPKAEAAHAVVAGFLGLELLAESGGGRDATLALFARLRTWATWGDALATPRRIVFGTVHRHGQR